METVGLFLGVFVSIMFIFVSIISFLGNGTVLFTIYKHPCLQNSFNIFVISLAIVGIFNALLSMPFAVAMILSTSQILNKPLCLAHTILPSLIPTVSLASLALMTINRYYRVVKPTVFAKVFSSRRTVMLAASSWLFSLVLLSVNIAALSPFSEYKLDDVICYRLSMPLLGVLLYIILFMVCPTAVIAIFYFMTHRFIYRPRASILPALQAPTVQRMYVEDTKTLRALLILLLCSYCCLFPATILWLVEGTMTEPPSFVSVLVLLFQYLTTVVVPAVYVFVSRYYRKELWKIISCKDSL